MQRIGKFETFISEKGILTIRCPEPKTKLSRADAELAFPTIRDLAGETKRLVIFDSRNVISADWQNQSYVSEQLEKIAIAGALVTNSNIEVVLGTIFMKVWPPSFPMQIFGSEEKAVDWLLSQAG